MISQTPWIERKFDFNFPVGLFPVIKERLWGTIPRLYELVKNIPEEKLSIKKDGGWSVKEVIGHLFDLEELWMGRLEDFIEKKETLRAADMSNTKTHQSNYNSFHTTELLEQFKGAREKLLEKIAGFDEAMASATALHPRLQKPMRVVDSLFFAAEHDDHELTKIRNLLS